MKEIVFIGTSFTYGGGFHEHFNEEVVNRYKNKGIEVSLEESPFPAIVSKNLNLKYRNLGKSGASIEYLMRNVENIFYNEEIKSKILVLEYSNWGRSELYSTRLEKYVVANWGPRDGIDVKNRGYETYITPSYEDEAHPTQYRPNMKREMQVFDSYLNRFQNEQIELIKRDRQFLNLLYKLNYHGIRYYIICLENVYAVELENDPMFTNHLIKMQNKNTGYTLYEFVGENNWTISDDVGEDLNDSHPSVKGHQEIAKIITERIKNDTIL